MKFPLPLRAALLALAPILAMLAGPACATPSVLVRVTRLEQGTLPQIVTAYGKVEAPPAARREVMAPVGVVVQAVYVHRGEQVTKDTPLLKIAPSPASTAAYARAVSELRVARELAQRTGKMAAQHLATVQQQAAARKAELDARATLDELQSEGAAGPRDIRARSAAIVTAVATSPGALVPGGGPLLTLVRPSGLVLRLGVVPGRARHIGVGDPVQITAMDSQGHLQGRVVLRGAAIDAQSGLAAVEVSLPPGTLLPGEMARAEISTGQAHGYLIAHQAILVDEQGAPYVVQVVDGKAQRVPVRILASHGNQDVVTGQLDAGAPVVLAGNYQLDNGMQVRYATQGNSAK